MPLKTKRQITGNLRPALVADPEGGGMCGRFPKLPLRQWTLYFLWRIAN